MVVAVIVAEKNKPNNAPQIKKLLSNCGYEWMEIVFQSLSMSDKVRVALKRATQYHPKEHVLVISAEMSTVSSSTRVKSMIEGGRKAIEEDLDLLYLFKHNDYCHKLRSTSSDKHHKTYHPCGLDAVVYTPSGIDKILGRKELEDGSYIESDENLEYSIPELIHDGMLTAVSTNINLFDYDVHAYANSDEDICKGNRCAPLQRRPQKIERTGLSGIIYLVVVIVIVLLVAWALLYMGPKG